MEVSGGDFRGAQGWTGVAPDPTSAASSLSVTLTELWGRHWPVVGYGA